MGGVNELDLIKEWRKPGSEVLDIASTYNLGSKSVFTGATSQNSISHSVGVINPGPFRGGRWIAWGKDLDKIG
jgi:hypothetical protein